MPAAERSVLPLLLFLPSLLLISCLDEAGGAAEEGGGLPSSSPGDNGLTVAVVGEQSAPGRFPSTPAVIEGKHKGATRHSGIARGKWK